MAEVRRDVWITGVGLVSPLGESNEVHGSGLASRPQKINTSDWTPYSYFPLAPIEFDRQIPKKSDQRQMAQCQRIGTYAAGLALESAGLKGDTERLHGLDMVVTALGGERDMAVDMAALRAVRAASDPAVCLNETLMTELRPTFFLGQLPNLLAGNIAIVHGVTGSADVLLGEEQAGVDAVRIAAARIDSGQSDCILAGAGYNGTRKDTLLYLVSAGHAFSGEFRPVFEREASGGGIVLSSIGAFLVLEAADAARKRGARPIAKLTRVVADAASGDNEASRATALEEMWSLLEPQLNLAHLAVISGASGAEPATSLERRFLAQKALPVRATGSHLGHAPHAQFPANIAIASLLLTQRKLYPPSDSFESSVSDDLRIEQIVVTGVGRNYGEGLALIEAIGTDL